MQIQRPLSFILDGNFKSNNKISTKKINFMCSKNKNTEIKEKKHLLIY